MDVEPLYGIRLRTPRLELRLPTRVELLALRDLARGGVHPPDFMPFMHAWTDEAAADDFVVGFFERRLGEWRPEDWAMAFGVWADGDLTGVQDVTATDFAATRTVATGSWLGLRFQKRGIGTEMRTAVLEFAFRGLGAAVARSGYVDGNDASRRVAEKLGYRVAGRSEVRPRGEPVGQTDVELHSADWRPPFSVRIEGLEPALPLFGL